MANLRVIKKDVIFLVNEVISDCFTYLSLYPERPTENVEQIIQDAIALGDATFDRINHLPKKDIKKYFKDINNDFLTNIDALFKRLSEEHQNSTEKKAEPKAKKAKAPAKKSTKTKTEDKKDE